MAKLQLAIYYKKMLNQYLEMKKDLADFEKALADGYITEDKLVEVKEDVAKLEANYERIAFIMFKLEEPRQSKRKEKWKKQNSELFSMFNELGADVDSVEDENESLLKSMKEQLKTILENNKENKD